MRRRDFTIGLLLTSATGVLAQEPAKQHRIAIIIASGPVTHLSDPTSHTWQAFWNELRRLGDVEGQNLTVERYSGEGRPEGYADLAREVVSRNPDVAVAISSSILQAVGAATGTIPIVTSGIIPELVPNLGRPEGNITGITVLAGSKSTGNTCRSSRKPSRRHRRSRSWTWTRGPTGDAVAKRSTKRAGYWKSR